MTREQNSRQRIDRQLGQCGWIVQNFRGLDISAAMGVAVREFPLKNGFADYLLYVGGRVVGVIEAKPEGHLAGFRLGPALTPLASPVDPIDKALDLAQ